jgi:predicted ATP-grasp superfamily ATP-dependent carboligase
MRFPLHASLPNSSRRLLIAAISGRALAAAARRAGYAPLVADFFCDTDTVALAERTAKLPGDLRSGIDGAAIADVLRRLAGRDEPVALVLGSGFERQPGIVDELARHFPIAGNRTEAIRRVKDPQILAADCAALDIPHPAFRFDTPPDPENWMAKAVGGAGGVHVAPASGRPPAPDRYFQRFVAGQSVSALFVASGNSARIVGFSRQWLSPAPGSPYRYGGAVRLRRFQRSDAEKIGGWLSALTRRAGLVGLCSADFIRNADGCHLVEINPRPGATLDIFDSEEAPLMEAHLRAARGEPYRLPRFANSMASMITYASRAVPEFPPIPWPDWTADHQSPGTRLTAGDPVCTVFARGASAGTTERAVRTHARQLQRQWEGDRA